LDRTGYEDVLDTDGQLPGFVVRRFVGDLVRVEYDEVRDGSGPDHTAIGETEPGRRE